MKKAAFLLLGLAVAAATPAHADATAGATIFKTKCGMCHAADANKIGPQLNNVVGRKAGSIAGFAYSSAVKASGLTWDEATLDKWLTGPGVLVPGTKMVFKLATPQERTDVIDYLKTLVSKP
jgi:cytochrome c